MILQQSLIDVRSGQEEEWEAAFRRAVPWVTQTPGCHGIRLTKSLETPHRYFLTITWDTVDDHLVDLHGSDRHDLILNELSKYWNDASARHYEPVSTNNHTQFV